MNKKILAFGFLFAAIVLAGCLQPPEQPGPGTNVPPGVPVVEQPSVTEFAISLKWGLEDGENIASYNVYRSTTSNAGYIKINTETVSSQEYADSSIAAKTAYYYRVTAVDLNGIESSYSNEVSATSQDIVIGIEEPGIKDCYEKETVLQKDSCFRDIAIEKNNPEYCSLLKVLSIDACLKSIGVKTNDYSVCDKITANNLDLKDSCYKQIAVSLADVKVCKFIIDNTVFDACIKTISSGATTVEECELIADVFDRDNCYKNQAANTKNYLFCKSVSTSIVAGVFNRDSCLDAVLASVKDEAMCDFYLKEEKKLQCFETVANEKNSIILCQNLNPQLRIDKCILEVNKDLLKTENCLLIGDQNVRLTCFNYVAEKNPIEATCEYLTSVSAKDACRHDAAVTNEDKALCAKVIDNALRDDCYSKIAISLGDHDICELVRQLNPSVRETCFSTVALNKLDTSICLHINIADYYVKCFSDIAVALSDHSVCYEAKRDYTPLIYPSSQICIYNYAQAKKDIAACEKIGDLNYRQKCKDALATAT